jgi:hypothetical protein
MTTTLPTIAKEAVSIEIGGTAIPLRTQDPSLHRLVKLVFQSACEFASVVPVRHLVFVPDQLVWDIIR